MPAYGELRIGPEEARRTMARALELRGFAADRAELSASLFVEATLEGVSTHGLERFPRFVEWIERGLVIPDASPSLVSAAGALERWDGCFGPGNLNALAMADRAVALARTQGLGCVGLAHTNHWMRGGQYGLRIAEAGLAGICWTNTMPNLPAWGSREAVLGNNPLVIALPRAGGPVLLDMAMSQYSLGKIEAAKLRGEQLTVEAGYDSLGMLTRNPTAVLESKRLLPMGYWKGSGLSLILDLLCVMLSGGNSVGETLNNRLECGLSQVFIAFDLERLATREELEGAVAEMEARVHGAAPSEGSRGARFPGEGRLSIKAGNLANGLPLREALWADITRLADPASVTDRKIR